MAINPETEQQRLDSWQGKLLPWFILMPTALIGIFIFLATRQMTHFNEVLHVSPDSTLMTTLMPNSNQLAQDKDYLRWVTLAKLEQESYYRRYNQGSLLLMSRIYTQYLGFFTGMILAIVGSVFIIGKIREKPTTAEISTGTNLKMALASSSPGIIFGLLGTFLMLSTILTHNEVTVEDSPLYLNAGAIYALDPSHAPPTSAGKLDVNKVKEVLSDQKKSMTPCDTCKKINSPK